MNELLCKLLKEVSFLHTEDLSYPERILWNNDYLSWFIAIVYKHICVLNYIYTIAVLVYVAKSR